MAGSPVPDDSPGIKTKENLKAQKLKSSALFTVPDALSAYECDAFIKYAEALGFTHQGSLGPSRGEAFRDNDRISVQSPELANKLWNSGLSKLFSDIRMQGKSAIGLNPNLRFYRYTEGQRFGPHIDESVDVEGGYITQYTLLVYLNGGGKGQKKSNSQGAKNVERHLQGGETVFYVGRKGDSIEVAPVAGMALFHLHGEKCLLHEARVVSKGVKYVLRSDVVFG